MQPLLKIALLGIFLAGMISFVHADAFVVDPVVQKAKPAGELDLGSISPGEKLEVIFSTDSGYGNEAQERPLPAGPEPVRRLSPESSRA